MYTPGDSIGKCNLMMDLISQRQRALSANIANIDTPNYIRKDVNFGQYLDTVNSPLETKLSQKLGSSGVITEKQGEVNPVFELTEMHKNAILYKTAVRRMSAAITNIKTAMNVGS